MHKIIGMVFLLLLPCLTQAEADYYRMQTIKRIRPLGTVRIQSDIKADESTAAAETKQEKPLKAADKGTEIYQKYCSVCHQSGVAGAPKFQNETDWKPRLAQGMDKMIANAMNGINAMPPKGTCAECTEADIVAAIKHMAPQS